ncbi:hypothetical protein MJG53_011311 [Ovis ammon polii x Ovis aries]|uniref:Uncharacterized protein n=1 Tax=Ovis ammon polii x Ovis aries TaxID=2918886 RepID=A0ACB9USZ7_9CETA|nr:hypothetical protein MJG53_011311 [Ovis ammon polii x Ovis aries]
MSEQERIQECLRKEIRSLLISTKDGLTPQQLEKEYLLMVGNHLPLRILGYRSTMELVLDMPDVVSVCPCGDGTVILKAVVKSELKDLLALSPVLLSDFENAFANRFGRSFQYVQYGFLSMFEVLNAASDVVSVEQTRAGSLLTLKKSVSEEKQRGWPAGKIFTQPFRMKQQGSYPIGFPVAKACFSQPTSNMEPPKQILDMERNSRSNVMETSRLNHSEKLNQLENTFKSVIAQIGPGGTINPELKHKIKFLIFKEQLSPKKLGFLNVIELVGALSDILHVEFREGEQDLLVFDADMKPLASDGAVSSVRNSFLVQSDKKIEAKACVSSPPRNSLSTAVIKETTWDCPSKNHKEPEQKIFKKPNLVVKPLQLQVEMNKSQLNLAMANHDIPPDAVRDKKLCRLPPLDTSTLVGVFVEYILSPSQFYIRIYSRDSSELLEDMMIEMRRCYSNQLVSDRYAMPECFIQPGHLCCVRISEDKWWYRVIIHRILGKQEVEVFYPDFGNIGTVQKSSLRFLKCCYTKLPAQAIPCSLAWGFRDLNPLALYTKSSVRPEDIVLKELGYHSQQHYFNEDREISPQSKESDLYTLQDINDEKTLSHLKSVTSEELLKDSKLNSLEIQDKSCEEDPKWSIPELKDLKEENEDEIPTGMPCLESVTIGDDIWDENWLPLQAKMGKESDAASHLFTSSLGGKKPYSSCKEIPQKDWCFPTPEDIWDDSWQPSGLVNGMKVEVQIPEGLGAQEKHVDTTRIQKQSNVTSASDSPVLPKLEEFYISLIQSQQSAEGGQFEPSNTQTPPKQIQLSSPLALVSSGSVEGSPESLENEDFSSSSAITVFKDTSQGAVDQLSLILSPEHQISQKFYIPRSTATAALGAAARLATSKSLLHWYPSVKKMET